MPTTDDPNDPRLLTHEPDGQQVAYLAEFKWTDGFVVGS